MILYLEFLVEDLSTQKALSYTISKNLGYRLSPHPSSLKLRFDRGALVDRCVAPVDRNGIIYCQKFWKNKFHLLEVFKFSIKDC
jgi:hypothetical protein